MIIKFTLSNSSVHSERIDTKHLGTLYASGNFDPNQMKERHKIGLFGPIFHLL